MSRVAVEQVEKEIEFVTILGTSKVKCPVNLIEGFPNDYEIPEETYNELVWAQMEVFLQQEGTGFSHGQLYFMAQFTKVSLTVLANACGFAPILAKNEKWWLGVSDDCARVKKNVVAFFTGCVQCHKQHVQEKKKCPPK